MTKVDAVLAGLIVISLLSILISLIFWLMLDCKSFNKFCSYFLTSLFNISSIVMILAGSSHVALTILNFKSKGGVFASNETLFTLIATAHISGLITFVTLWGGAEVIKKIKRRKSKKEHSYE